LQLQIFFLYFFKAGQERIVQRRGRMEM
jgi:hypothetical protein